MPPKKGVNASPASQRGGGRLAAPSPARSTRSTRSHKGDDEWDPESVQASYKMPAPTAKHARGNGLSLKDTSVNVAAAFHAAQNGHLPTPNSSAQLRPPSRGEASTSKRAVSPVEKLAGFPRALSPVRYFLHPTDSNESGEYNSFSTLANQSSTNTSYDYQQEEAFVKAQMAKTNGHDRRASESKRRKKAEDEDMPYRPAEDDWVRNSDGSDSEGQGLVRGGALEGRAATRGKTKEKGEGYLGNGLGIQPRKRVSKAERDISDEDHSDGSDRNDQRGLSPVASHHGRDRVSPSPIPAQLMRAISPRMSPDPRPVAARRRQPPPGRVIFTNLLQGVVETLRFITELLVGVLKTVVIKPIEMASGSSKSVLRHFRQNWWKLLGAAIALSLALRLLDRPNTSTYDDNMGLSFGRLQDRLLHLEQSIAGISDDGSRHGDNSKSVADLLDRIARLEAALTARPSPDQPERHAKTDSEIHKLGARLQEISSRVGDHDKAIASARSDLQITKDLSQELRAVEKRVSKVEDEMRIALDDGRLRQAVERILPEYMPIKRSKGGRIDVEPVFWTEMKRVLAGKDDIDKAVQAGLAGVSSGSLSEKELDRWGDRLFANKAASGLVITRDQFLQAMNNELEDLKIRIDQSRQAQPASSKPSTVVVRNAKGDDITSMLQQLVDAAILKYSKDTLAKPDHALFTAGARVVPSITSDTLLLQSASRLGKWFAGSRDVEGRPPATALHPDNSVGSCWPFEGHRGQLGILLSRRVVVSDITIEHAAKELSPDVATAPRTIEVWGLVEGDTNKAKVVNYMESRVTSTPSASIPPSSDHLLLATIEYDPQADHPIQTFPVPPAITEMGIDMGIVVFKIESNWGGDLTCLYRVRVHGNMLDEEQAQE